MQLTVTLSNSMHDKVKWFVHRDEDETGLLGASRVKLDNGHIYSTGVVLDVLPGTETNWGHFELKDPVALDEYCSRWWGEEWPSIRPNFLVVHSHPSNNVEPSKIDVATFDHLCSYKGFVTSLIFSRHGHVDARIYWRMHDERLMHQNGEMKIVAPTTITAEVDARLESIYQERVKPFKEVKEKWYKWGKIDPTPPGVMVEYEETLLPGERPLYGGKWKDKPTRCRKCNEVWVLHEGDTCLTCRRAS